MDDLQLTENEFKVITDEIQAVIEKCNEQPPYGVIEIAIRKCGRSIPEAQKIIGICYVKGMFLKTIESWTHIPQEIKHYITESKKRR